MRRDGGSVTVWAAMAMAAVWIVVTVVLGYGAAVIGRHQAETAADLAALAAAAHVPDGPTVACAAGAATAVRNGGTLSACRVAGDDVEITVFRPVRLGRFGIRPVLARARAGPVEDRGPP